MPRTKAALIESLSTKAKLPLGRADSLVNRVFDCMTEALMRGEGIEIRGFGSFSIRSYRARAGRNPKSGETSHVKAKRSPFFKVGKELRERLNGAAGTPARAR
ncbi:MAG: HU family DNA-binding protein [Myxococcales bacterium]